MKALSTLFSLEYVLAYSLAISLIVLFKALAEASADAPGPISPPLVKFEGIPKRTGWGKDIVYLYLIP